ncbi:cytochrome b561-like isoform X2, partial [Dinothrombium tinctorium]
MEGTAINSRENNAKIYLNIYIGSQIVGLLAICLTVVWISRYLEGFGWDDPILQFNYHPFFMVLGLVVVYGNSILVYRVLRKQRKYYLKLVHAALNFLAFIFASFAIFAVFDFHNRKNIPNMYSLHSWIGLGTFALFGLQFVGGFISFLSPGLAPFYRKLVMPYHIYGGVTLFAMACASCISGITEKALFSIGAAEYKKLPSAAFVLNFLGLSIVVFGLLVTFLVTREDYKRQPLPEEQNIQTSRDQTSSTF